MHIAFVGEIVNAYIIGNDDDLDEDDEFDDNDILDHIKNSGKILDEDDFDRCPDDDED